MSSGEDDGGEQAEEESDEQTCEPRELFSLGQLSTDGQLSTECQKARGGEGEGERLRPSEAGKIGEIEYLWAVAATLSSLTLCSALTL